MNFRKQNINGNCIEDELERTGIELATLTILQHIGEKMEHLEA